MLIWSSLMLLINVCLVSSIVYILFRSRRAFKAVISTAEMSISVSARVADAMKNEITALRDAEDACGSRTRQVEEMETRIVERQREIEQVLSRARDVARHIDSIYNRRPEGVDYQGAVELLKSGMPSEEAMARLGLLKGEFELISNISNYRS